MSNIRNNPRIVVTINDDNVVCKGVYIDKWENTNSFNKVFNAENDAMHYLNNMRDTNAEFSIQINRNNWKSYNE